MSPSMNNNMNDCIYLCWQCYVAGVFLSVHVGLNKSHTSMSMLAGNFGEEDSNFARALSSARWLK